MAQVVKQAGLRFTAKTPRVVVEGLGFCWYPSIRQFSTGELIVSYSLNPDSGEYTEPTRRYRKQAVHA